MIAPFFGCATGAFLYDTFMWTGDSPINTPGLGLKRLLSPNARTWSNTRLDNNQQAQV